MTATVITADVLDALRSLPDNHVNCVVTSPPYWGLRDYGVDGQIGLETDFWTFLDRMLTVFDEVHRVLKPDGTCWVNMGDSYAASATSDHRHSKGNTPTGTNPKRSPPSLGFKPKDLIGQPWRLAFGLQERGWYLRRDIIWHKSNPMPESCKDRPTTAHEYIFLLTKGSRYYYDAEVIKEAVSGTAHARRSVSGWAEGAVKHTAIAHSAPKELKKQKASKFNKVRYNDSYTPSTGMLVERRNKRSVWTIATQRFPEAHFATYPEKLVEPCILAGCPPGGLVIDPFTGSGTTGVVAIRHGRHFLGIELNPEYADMARRRMASVQTSCLTDLHGSPAA